MANSKKYPEAWKRFVEDARNIEGHKDSVNGKYCIHHPTKSEFIYSDDPAELFIKFKNAFYAENINSPSVYGKIQYIVNNF
jgi:hypothetical protein